MLLLQVITSSAGASVFEFPSDSDKVKFHRTASIQAFNKRSHANEMLNGLRYFERPQKSAEGKR